MFGFTGEPPRTRLYQQELAGPAPSPYSLISGNCEMELFLYYTYITGQFPLKQSLN